MKRLVAAAIFAICLRAGAQAPRGSLGSTIRAMTAEPAVARAHWGVVVTAMDGSPIFAMNEEQMFRPASNAKLFTTAAALALLRHQTFETRVVGKGHFTGANALTGDLVLVGDGDANLSGRAIPYVVPKPDSNGEASPAAPLHYLEEMADAVAKSGLKVVNGDVVGDDTLFPWEPYADDWVIDDMVWGYGAPVSALSINDNQIKATVKPGAVAGVPAVVTLDPAVPYYTLDTTGLTTGAAKSASHVDFTRAAGSKVLRVYGAIAVGSPDDVEEIAISDPAEYAAVALKAMLEAAGVTVTGVARCEHKIPVAAEDFLAATRQAVPGLKMDGTGGYSRGSTLTYSSCDHCDPKILPVEKVLASHGSTSGADDVVITNKVSQNLHAELLLHQLGAAIGMDGSTAQGARVVRQFLLNAGIDKDDFVFFDGSGLSGHDLVTPRAISKLLQFASTQPWFAKYKASLPVGGVDGSLSHRFAEPPLKGHVFAKTGSLGEARALSGYLECASGRTVIFSVMVDNHAPGSNADREVMDRIVAAIAAAN